jgi:MFS family permease
MTVPQRTRTTDLIGSGASSTLFSFALGVSSVVLPLLALSVGYSFAAIGALTAVSGVAQLAVRSVVPSVSRHLSDRWIVGVSGLLMGASCLVVLGSTGWWPFLLCQLLQGAARGFFWTGIQLHAVRTDASSFRGIARINLFTSVGLLAGPTMAGLMAQHSMDLALLIAAGAGLAASAGSVAMHRLPVLGRARRTPGTRALTHPRVLFSCWLSAAAGAWSAIVVSYVPVLLAGHQPVALVGVLITLANAGQSIGSYAAGRTGPRQMTGVLVGSALANGLGLSVMVFATSSAWLSGLILVVAGLGAGALVTLGPAVATNLVDDDQRAGAIALTGGFRAGALLLTPLGIAGALSFAPVTAAIAVAGIVICLPVLWVRDAGGLAPGARAAIAAAGHGNGSGNGDSDGAAGPPSAHASQPPLESELR